MRLFDKQSSLWIVLFCLPLLFLPKINLISFGGRETAGVRIDDICLIVLSLIVFWAHFSLERRFYGIERQIVALTAFAVLSFFMNRIFVGLGWLHVNASIFYSLRLFEYFLFFYVGALAFPFFRLGSIIKAFFLWNMLLMLLQKFEIVGQFSTEGYLARASSRVAGIASFPSEAGLLLDMAFCYLVYDTESNRQLRALMPPPLRYLFDKTYIYMLFLLTAALVIFTGSRIAIAALVVIFMFRIKQEIKSSASLGSWTLALFFIGVAACAMTVLIFNTQAIFVRSAGLLSFKNLELASLVWDKIDLAHDPIGQEAVSNSSYDASWWMRIHKWCYAMKIYYLHPESYLQGIGPGFAMAGLDGGFLRILTEYGIIGCLLFWKLFSSIYHKTLILKWMIVAFAINMIFFDVYLAYKPMSLLFFITGYSYAMAANETRQNNPMLTTYA